jgi:hypothetical protein
MMGPGVWSGRNSSRDGPLATWFMAAARVRLATVAAAVLAALRSEVWRMLLATAAGSTTCSCDCGPVATSGWPM